MRGKLTENAPLGAKSWFGCGGCADLLFQPADIDDLAEFLKRTPTDTPLTIIGGLANTIIRDGGIRGVTIQLGKAFANITPADHDTIVAGTGALNGSVAAKAVKAELGGLEFLSGIPGTLGGALRMNAGAYGAEIADIFVEATALDRAGTIHTLGPADMGFAYRHTDVPEDLIFVETVLRGTPEPYEVVKARITDIKAKRNETQPIREKTGGSTFANPTAEELEAAGLPPGTKAWQLVEMVGGRGLSIGGAQISEKHCNFMVNTGTATASDLEALGDELISRVKDETGLSLRWEIRRVGAQC